MVGGSGGMLASSTPTGTHPGGHDAHGAGPSPRPARRHKDKLSLHLFQRNDSCLTLRKLSADFDQGIVRRDDDRIRLLRCNLLLKPHLLPRLLGRLNLALQFAYKLQRLRLPLHRRLILDPYLLRRLLGIINLPWQFTYELQRLRLPLHRRLGDASSLCRSLTSLIPQPRDVSDLFKRIGERLVLGLLLLRQSLGPGGYAVGVLNRFGIAVSQIDQFLVQCLRPFGDLTMMRVKILRLREQYRRVQHLPDRPIDGPGNRNVINGIGQRRGTPDDIRTCIRERHQHLAWGVALKREDGGSHRKPLSEVAHLVELALQQRVEFTEIQFLDVKLVVIASLFRIDDTVWRRHHQQPIRTQYPTNLINHLLMTVVMFDRLKRNHQVHAAVLERDPCRISPLEMQALVAGIRTHGVLYGFVRDVHTGDRTRILRQQGAAISFTARNIEDVLAWCQRRAPCVAMHVLVPDVATLARNVSLTGKFHDLDAPNSILTSCIGIPTNPWLSVLCVDLNVSASCTQCCCVWSSWVPV